MKVVVVGATGTIGSAVVKAFEAHGDDVIAASRASEPPLDMTDEQSVAAFFEQVGPFDAIVCTAGSVPFLPLSEASAQHFTDGFANKFQGQVNLVLHGTKHLNDGGSFVLSTGILNRHPVQESIVASSVNGAVEAFAYAASTELPAGKRINVISASVIEEALDDYGPFFPGFIAVPAARVAQFFVRAAHGVETGKVYTVDG